MRAHLLASAVSVSVLIAVADVMALALTFGESDEVFGVGVVEFGIAVYSGLPLRGGDEGAIELSDPTPSRCDMRGMHRLA